VAVVGVGGTLVDELLDDADVPLSRIDAELRTLEASARTQGLSPRSVHQARHGLARQVGDLAAAAREFSLWMSAPRDFGSGCLACERARIGDWEAEQGSDGRAFEAWSPLFAGDLFCDAEPHGVLARSLVPLVRLGKGPQARANHVSGYGIVRQKPAMSGAVGLHVEFCALTGNAARGLELLAEHGDWLAGRAVTARRAEFLGGVEVLLRVLSESGFDDLPFASPTAGTKAVGALREEVGEELGLIAARFDERNGTTAFSERLIHRRSRQPFLSALPLEARTALPQAGRRAAAVAPRSRARSVDELVAEARRLTAMWHPDALDAWRQVQDAAGRLGTGLVDEVRVELDEQLLLAGTDIGLRGNGETAAIQHRSLLEIAARYRELGRLGASLRAASRAAFALYRGGEVDAAVSEQAALRLAAADALAGREITAREYMAVRIGSGYQRFNAWLCAMEVEEEAGAREGGDGADGGGEQGGGGNGRGEVAAREAIEELAELVEECRRFRVSLHGAAAAGMAAEIHLGRDDEAAAGASLRLAVELYLAGGAPWSATPAELNLSQIARTGGDLAAAERYARSAVEHNLDPELRGPAAMMLAEAIWLQDGREAEAVAPALAAAAAFARQDGGADDEARAQVRAAEALAMVGRDDEAVALFEPALRVLDVHWAEDDWKPLIAQAARTYGNCLMAVGDPRRAAELLLGTAERVKDWPNQVPHAMMAADAATALERAGRSAEAAAAFQRAAQLWGTVGEPLVRVKCLRSAAWLLAGEDLDAALGLMDRAGGELVLGLPAGSERERSLARYELAETHMQRARVVLNLAADGMLPGDQRERLVEQAFQEICGAVSGLRRLLEAGADTEAESGTGAEVEAEQGDGDSDGSGVAGDATSAAGDRGVGADVLQRLAFATLVAARIEGGQQRRVVAAVARLRELARECERRGKAGLAQPLTEYADELARGPAVGGTG